MGDESPKNKVKYLCSHGGKVLGLLQYVGGETRVISVPCDITFSDEDLKHMIEEHDRHESGGSPMLRAFPFPSKPLLVDKQPSEPYLLEQP